jgi:hypothetical protein
VKRSRYIGKRESLGGWSEKVQKSAERRRDMDRGITIKKLINETKGNRKIWDIEEQGDKRRSERETGKWEKEEWRDKRRREQRKEKSEKESKVEINK